VSLDELDAKLPGLIRDLLEEDGGAEGYEVPVEVIASFSRRIKIGSAEEAA
jgi:hypothetical protein